MLPWCFARSTVWSGRLGGVATEHYDLIIIGAGSGNSIICPEMDTWKIAMVERSTFGGTCLNRGCIPSKMLIYPADLAEHAADSARYGIDTSFNAADWPAIVKRVFGRIDPIAEGGRLYRYSLPNVTVYEADSHFVGERTLQVGDATISADRIVIAAGARSYIPDIPGLDTVAFHTSDTILRIEEQPKHLVILGGGFIATEVGHVFRSLGSKVTIINRSQWLLKAEDHDVSMRFTELAGERFDLRLGARVQRVFATPGGVGVGLQSDEGGMAVEGDVLLVAVGRRANGDELRAPDGGIEIDDLGNIKVDGFGRTTSPGVWALGDINGRHQLKHMANGEAKAVRHNLLNPDNPKAFDDRPAPHAVFTSPQIGAIGLTENEAILTGLDIAVITQPYGSAAYGWALEDHTSFCKLIGDRATRKLLGAHVIGYQASILVQLLVQGMHLGATVDEMANGQVWIHPALSEVVEQALLSLIEVFDTPVTC
jgi:mycothione reductase